MLISLETCGSDDLAMLNEICCVSNCDGLWILDLEPSRLRDRVPWSHSQSKLGLNFEVLRHLMYRVSVIGEEAHIGVCDRQRSKSSKLCDSLVLLRVDECSQRRAWHHGWSILDILNCERDLCANSGARSNQGYNDSTFLRGAHHALDTVAFLTDWFFGSPDCLGEAQVEQVAISIWD